MSPVLTFFIGLGLLVLFGWYFATDVGLRKRLLATTLVMLLVAFSIATIWPPKEKIQLGLDIQGGTSFLIRLMGGDKDVNKGMLDQAVEVIRKRVDVFGVSEPVISPVGNDRILVQIPGLDTAKIQEVREQLSRVAKLEFRLVFPDNGERLRAIDGGKEVIPPEYRIEIYKMAAEENEKPRVRIEPESIAARKASQQQSVSFLSAAAIRPLPSAQRTDPPIFALCSSRRQDREARPLITCFTNGWTRPWRSGR